MKISIVQTKGGVFTLNFDDTVVTLDQRQIKQLLMAAVQALMPGAMPKVDPLDQAKAFARKVKTADPAGIQKFIMAADDEDILRFMKACEDDADLLTWMFENMSGRKQTMFKEDMEFRFKEGVPEDELGDAVGSLSDLANQLHHDGALEFEL